MAKMLKAKLAAFGNALPTGSSCLYHHLDHPTTIDHFDIA
jgi:hypothetical protein